MWQYYKVRKTLTDPSDSDIIDVMDQFGADGWEIITILESIVDKWTVHSETHVSIEYTMYMKKSV